MSARDTIRLVLTRHYRREDNPHGAAVDMLGQYDAAHRAEVLAGDGQAYDGELAMLRGLVRTLRVVVRDDVSAEKQRAEVRRLLHHHAADEAAAREEAKGGERRG